MGGRTNESDKSALRLDFDYRLMLQFRDSEITADAELLAYRKLDDALTLTGAASEVLVDGCIGKNDRYRLAGRLC